MAELPSALCLAAGCLALSAYDRGWSVCARHGLRAGDQLAALGGEYGRLCASPGQGTGGEPVHGGKLAHQLSPANLDVLVATDSRSKLPVATDPDANTAPAVLAWVLAWAAAVRVAFPADAAGSFAVARRQVSAHLDWVLAGESAGQFCDELRGYYRALLRLNAAPLPRPRRSACRGCGSVGTLSWDGETASCASCGGSWSGLAVLRP